MTDTMSLARGVCVLDLCSARGYSTQEAHLIYDAVLKNTRISTLESGLQFIPHRNETCRLTPVTAILG